MNIKNAVEKVKTKMAGESYFYLTNDPERALGLEGLLDINIVHIDKTQYLEYFKAHNYQYFCLEEAKGEMNSMYRSSVKLIKSEQFLNYFSKTKSTNNYLQTFKISPAFEKASINLNTTLINTPARLNRLFENKLSQFTELFKEGIDIPKTEILILKETNYQALSEKYGKTFVIQFNLGHTGEGTTFIDSDKKYLELSNNFPQREVKVSEYIEGESYTLNACITKEGVLIGGLNYQITGIPELTSYQGGTVGNDWECRTGFDEHTLDSIVKNTKRIGERMKAGGYLGLFGIDLIVKAGKPYIIEVNARQPASVPMQTKIQLQQNQVPLSLLHIMAFLDIKHELDIESYNIENLKPLPYSQIFNRAKIDLEISSDIKMGVYRLLSDNSAINRETGEPLPNTIFLDEEKDKPLVFQKDGYTIDDLDVGGMLLLVPVRGKQIKAGSELCRLQLKQSVINNNRLDRWVIESLTAVENQLK